MFSWITGPRISNAIEDLRPESNYESTFIDQPETPAHQFAVKAFKQAIFGTPAPEIGNEGGKRAEKKAKIEAANAKPVELPAPKHVAPPVSPSKQPGGILMTPGTANKGRKTVSFGSHVVDNEGKRGNGGKSGIPNDCPGKFPSPWTPGTQLKLDPSSDQRPRTKLTEALLDARTTTQPKSGQKPKARDDSDITLDLGAPRSESGKYWKEQYESYAERSEKELKKVIAKQQLAKKYALKKDGEVTELATKLEQERKRFRQRERELEQQASDYQEQLCLTKNESESARIEIAALKARVATLERSISIPSSELQQTKASFEIYEDSSKELFQLGPEQEKPTETPFAPSFSMASSGKENASPKPPRHRRQTLSNTIDRSVAPTRVGVGEGEASIILGKSPRKVPQLPETASAPAPSIQSEQLSNSPIKTRRTEHGRANSAPKSPVPILPSSPLPVGSPDPWLDMNQSSIPQMDKMAMPGFSGAPYSRPAWNPPPRQHRSSKSVSNVKHTEASFLEKPKKEKVTITATITKAISSRSQVKGGLDTESKPETQHADDQPGRYQRRIEALNNTRSVVTESKFDVSNIASHHADGSIQVKRSTLDTGIDRKEQARRRLEQRKKLRKNTVA